MSDAPNPTSVTPLHALFVALLLALALFVYAGAWLGVAAWLDGFHGWMALLAAPVMLAPLQLMGMPAGVKRGALATCATAAAIAFASWLVVAVPIADAMGLTPLAAAQRMGPHFAWTLLSLAHAPLDWFWTLLSLAFAAWSGYRGGDGVSGRRRAP